MKIAQGQEFYLTESLKQHPSAFIIFDKDLTIKGLIKVLRNNEK